MLQSFQHRPSYSRLYPCIKVGRGLYSLKLDLDASASFVINVGTRDICFNGGHINVEKNVLKLFYSNWWGHSSWLVRCKRGLNNTWSPLAVRFCDLVIVKKKFFFLLMHCGYHLTHPLLCLNEGSFTAVVESNSNSNTRPKKKKDFYS